MGPLSWKWLLLSAACGQPCSQSENCEDQTALLQSHLASHKSATLQASTFPAVSQLLDPAHRKNALLQLETTAVELVQAQKDSADDPNGVSAVCGVVKEVLSSDVWPMIQTSRNDDQASLDTTLATGSDAVATTYAGHKSTIDQFNVDAALKANHSIQCASMESDLCIECQDCVLDCLNTTSDCEDWFTWLKNNYTELLNHVTVGGTCTVDPITSTYVIQMDPVADNVTHEQWSEERHAALEEAWANYNFTYHMWTLCAEAESTDCNKCWCPNTTTADAGDGTDGGLYDWNETHQEQCPCQTLEERYNNCTLYDEDRIDWQCQHSNLGDFYQSSYDTLHGERKTEYDTLVANVRIREEDRKKEWETIDHIICLLNLLIYNESNPNQTAYDGWVNETVNAAVIQACRTIVDVTHLDHNMSAFPPALDLPDVDSPCSQTFTHVFHGCAGVVLGDEEQNSEGECTCDAYIGAGNVSTALSFPDAFGPFLTLNPYLTTNEFMVNAMATEWALFGTDQTTPLYTGKIVGIGAGSEAGYAYPASCLTAATPCTIDPYSPISGLLTVGGLISRTLETDNTYSYEVKQLILVPSDSIVVDSLARESRLLLETSGSPGCFDVALEAVPATLGATSATGWRHCMADGLNVFEFQLPTGLVTFQQEPLAVP